MFKGYLNGKKEGLLLAESVVIGLQNESGDIDSDEYKLLQKVYERLHEFTEELSEAERSYRDEDRGKS